MRPFGLSARRGRLVVLLATVLSTALGAVGLGLLRPTGGMAPAQPGSVTVEPGRAAGQGTSIAPRSVYTRVAPSVVDVTATLRYDGETASGTGFVINPRAALVLTNNHVVRDATSVTVAVPSTGQSYPARIVGVDVTKDVAVLQIGSVPGIAQAPIGDSATVGVGTPVVAIGNQAGADGSPAFSSGVISGTGETIQATDGASSFTETLHHMLVTTARIEPGDSGGPLANAAGTVIGIDTAAGTDGSTSGYAIPINTAMAAERQITDGHHGPGIALGTGGFLGAVVGSTSAPDPRVQAARERLPRTAPMAPRPATHCLTIWTDAQVPAAIAPARSGALVDGVLCDTPAAAAGIAAGDVIIRADGHVVTSPDALGTIVSHCRPGTAVAVTWINTTGDTRTSRVRLSQAPAA